MGLIRRLTSLIDLAPVRIETSFRNVNTANPANESRKRRERSGSELGFKSLYKVPVIKTMHHAVFSHRFRIFLCGVREAPSPLSFES